MYQVSVDGTSLGLRLVKTEIPMPKSGSSVISVPQPGHPDRRLGRERGEAVRNRRGQILEKRDWPRASSYTL
jgi:hypothetical protein